MKKLADSKTMLAAGLVRGDGTVVCAYYKVPSISMFNLIARESAAVARRRSIRHPALGKPKYILAQYDKLTMAVIIPTDQFFVYGVCRTNGNPRTILKKLQTLSRKIEGLLS